MEFRLFNSSSIFNITLREELFSLPKQNQTMHSYPGFMALVTWVKFLGEKLKATISLIVCYVVVFHFVMYGDIQNVYIYTYICVNTHDFYCCKSPSTGPPSQLGPVGPPGGPVTSLGWCRRSRWQSSQVAGSGDPRRPTLGKGLPQNLSTAPHGGWSKVPRCPSCLGTSLTWGFPAPFWHYMVVCYVVTVLFILLYI